MKDIYESAGGLSPAEKRVLLAQLLKKEVEKSNAFPLSFAQERLWFLEQLEDLGPTYNVWLGVRLKGPLQIEILGRCFKEILRRHEILCTTFSMKDGQPLQVIGRTFPVTLPLVDLQQAQGEEQESRMIQLAGEEVERPFDLEKGPLLRLKLFRLGPKDHGLVMTMHHIISDAWSVNIFIREMAELYYAYTRGESSPLPELPLQYVDFAAWQRQWLKGDVQEELVNYWKQQMAGAPGVMELPFDHPRPSVQTYRGSTMSFEIDHSLTRQLKQLSLETRTTFFMVLLAVFFILLSRLSGKDDIVIGTPAANRSRREFEGLIGFFINTLLIRLDLRGNPTFLNYLQRVRQVALEAYAQTV